MSGSELSFSSYFLMSFLLSDFIEFPSFVAIVSGTDSGGGQFCPYLYL